MNIFVILPAYNEAENLRPLLSSLFDVSARLNSQAKLTPVLVDDGSTDGTEAVAKDFQARGLDYVKHETNQGFPQALRTGLGRALQNSRSETDAVLIMDADNTHPAETIPPMLSKLEEGFQVVIASRYCPGGSQKGVSILRRFLSRGCGWILKTFFKVEGVQDYTSSFRMIRVGTLRRLSQTTGGKFFFNESFVCACEFLYYLKSAGARFAEVPLNLRYDLRLGHSKMNLPKTVWGYIGLISDLRKGKTY